MTENNTKLQCKEQNLPELIRDITFFYIKHYYEKELESRKVTTLSNDIVIKLVNSMYEEKQTALKKYIIETLKENLGNEYPKLKVNMILVEMFEDSELAKQRVINEIIIYQENSNNKNK